MAKGRGVQIVGAAEFQTANKRMGDALARNMLLALEAGAAVAETRWKELAPVRTGTYRRSIHTVGRIVGNAVEVIVGTNLTNPPYPIFLEYGTRFMRARPSARPAFDQTLPKVLATARIVLAKLNAKAARRG